MLTDDLLQDYARNFYGFGNWKAKCWFVGIEEAGGWREADVQDRLDVWKSGGKKALEDATTFYQACGNDRWHGASAVAQETWRQLIRMRLVARGAAASDDDVLNYQRTFFGTANGRECLLELLPLPSLSTTTWNYAKWSALPWLKSRVLYQNHLTLSRAYPIQQKIEEHRPKVVIFYSSSWHRVWGLVARGVWSQAIRGKLMAFERDRISYYVTRHPRAETDEYFREIGEFLRKRHGRQR